MKIFDVTFSKAPYIRQHYGPHKIYQSYLEALYLLTGCSIVLYGYVVLQKLLFVYVVSFICVWLYRFFSQRGIFRSDTWQIYVLLYVLILNHSTSWQETLFGVVVMMIFGFGFFYINKQYIFNPVILAIVSIIAFGIYAGGINIRQPLYHLFFLLKAENTQLGQPSLWITIRDMYHLFAGSIEDTYLYTHNPSIITDMFPDYFKKTFYFYSQQEDVCTWNWQYLFLSQDNLWMGAGSTFLILFIGFLLSFFGVINGSLVLIYVSIYTLCQVVYIWLVNRIYLPSLVFSYLSDHILWFTAVFLVTNRDTLPRNRKGQIYNILFIAIVSFLFSLRSYHHINHLIAILIGNMFAPFCEMIGRESVFGISNTLLKQSDFICKGNTLDVSIIIQRIMVATSIILIMLFSIYFAPKDMFLASKANFYPALIQDLFPSYVVGQSLDEGIYVVELERKHAGVVLFQSIEGYRGSIRIVSLIQDGVIVDLQMISMQGEHPLLIQQHWEHNFSGLHVDEIPSNIQTLASLNVDVLSGATISYSAILDAINLLKQRYKNLPLQDEERV